MSPTEATQILTHLAYKLGLSGRLPVPQIDALARSLCARTPDGAPRYHVEDVKQAFRRLANTSTYWPAWAEILREIGHARKLRESSLGPTPERTPQLSRHQALAVRLAIASRGPTETFEQAYARALRLPAEDIAEAMKGNPTP